MNKDLRKELRQLKKRKEFDRIYERFGGIVYRNTVPTWYAYEEKKNLLKQGKYEEIYDKYGNSAYQKVVEKAKYDEIKENQGLGKAMLYKASCFLKKIGIFSALFVTGFSALGSTTSQSLIDSNAKQYEKEIDENNERIQNYAEEIKAMNFTNLQNIMKVTDDMWSNIKGYRTPEKDIYGFFELDLSTPEGYGVCRNFATDVAKKLNEINPSYNARTINVYMSEEGYIKMTDIDRLNINSSSESKKENNVDNKESTKEKNSETKEDNKNETVQSGDSISSKLSNTFIGNHMVVLVDIDEDNVTLMVDPTNPSIGIYKDGKIRLLNPTNMSMDAKEYATGVLHGGMDGIILVAKDFISSFKNSKLSFEELEKKYGLEAQNKALKQVRAATIAQSSLNEEKDKFNERIKVTNLQNNEKKSNTFFKEREDEER